MSQLPRRLWLSLRGELRWYYNSKPDGESEVLHAGNGRREKRCERVLGVQPSIPGRWFEAHQFNHVYDRGFNNGQDNIAKDEGESDLGQQGVFHL